MPSFELLLLLVTVSLLTIVHSLLTIRLPSPRIHIRRQLRKDGIRSGGSVSR